MGSRGLLRFTATHWEPRPMKAASSLITSPAYHRYSPAVRSNRTCLNGPQHIHTDARWFIKGSARTTQPPAARVVFTKAFSSQATKPSPAAKPTRRHFLYILALLTITLPTLNQLRKPDPRTTLNKDLFTPCTVLSNVPISPTAFLLTIQLPALAANHAAVAEAQRHGLWSVEVKQPQLQIARHYTPMPGQRDGEGKGKEKPGQLRLYVRRYDGGEVSTYLSRLRAGQQVEIRGPHLGFDLGARLGEEEEEEEEEGRKKKKKKVVVLAGGTSVAPALQAGEFVLGRDGVDELEILWANRSGVDCAGCQRLPVERRRWFSSGTGAVDGIHSKEEEPGAVMRQIRDLQDAFERKGKRLHVKCAVDNEGSMVKARDIMDAVGRTDQLQGASSLSCHFHSQQQLERCTEESDVSSGGNDGDKRNIAAPQCTCSGEGLKGKNLFIISGPDGFVSAFVGPKVWADGAERQGPIGGVLSTLTKENPEFWKDWLILKQ